MVEAQGEPAVAVDGISVIAAVLAVVGAVLLAVGVGLIFVPAGVVTAGVVFLAAAYVVRYLEANE